MNSIQNIGRPVLPQSVLKEPVSNYQPMSFKDRLTKAVKEVNTLQHTADESADQVVQGKVDVHEGMLALNEADVSLRYMLQAKNKAVEAYREIMRMQL